MGLGVVTCELHIAHSSKRQKLRKASTLGKGPFLAAAISDRGKTRNLEQQKWSRTSLLLADMASLNGRDREVVPRQMKISNGAWLFQLIIFAIYHV